MVGHSPAAPRRFIGAATALLALIGAYAWLDGTQRELAHARSLKSSAYVGSAQCKHCHPSHFASFTRTFHSRMTREADSSSVLGAFDGRSLEYLGTKASMRQDHGGYWFSFQSARDAAATRVRVERTVGSHRYQQYLARDGDIYFRLPIAWDVARKQFFHMNGAFLTADPDLDAHGLVSNVDYNRHVTRWNDNCIYCHNVHPNPGLDAETGHFESEVAELGVACEACHGPGGEHAAHNSDPVRRYALHNSGAQDPSIRNPRRMSAARSAEVCGRCHGQRITSDIDRFHREGDPFVPGEELAEYSKPLTRDTRQNGEKGVFAARFWPDGSARLTAYEYQGYLQSPCRASNELSCESCHAMHDSEPAGQLRAESKGDAACTHCHTQLGAAGAAAAHAKHKPGSSGTACQSCHMPDIVYGLVSIHLSHRIESPAPQLQAAAGRPDACTLCHIDRTRTWASAALASHAAKGDAGASRAPSAALQQAAPDDPAARPGAAQARATPLDDLAARQSADRAPVASIDDPAAREGLSEVAYRLLAGDPIERAVAAHALGKRGAAAAPSFQRERLGLLFECAENDSYPAVRSIARSALEQLLAAHPRALEQLARFVPTARKSERRSVLDATRGMLTAAELADPKPALVANLRSQAGALAIEIGE